MRITKITAHPVWIGFRNQLLVKIETDEDEIYGWGESGLSTRERAVEGALHHLGEFLVGQDPMQRGRIWQEIYRSQYYEGDRVLAAALSAIDIALHDIVGKKLGVPVYELLGGRQREWIPTFATVSATTVEESVEQALLLAGRGWTCIRLGIVSNDDDNFFEPREALAATADACIQAREAVGHGVALGIDWHHRLSVAEAASFCQMLAPHTLDFLEEPIRDECPEAYDALRRLTPIPFAIGEEFASKWAFIPYIERGLTNFARIDVCNVGGLTESMKVAGWCEAHYIDLMPHNPLGPICSAATGHLAAAVPNFSWLEIRESPTEAAAQFYDREVFPVQPELADGKLTLLDVPGLGVDVNEEALGEVFRPAEMPHLRRRDGSVTNW